MDHEAEDYEAEMDAREAAENERLELLREKSYEDRIDARRCGE